MRTKIIGLFLFALGGCANFDPDQFQQALATAYAINQVTVQPQVDAMNAMSHAQAARLQQGAIYADMGMDVDWDWDEFHGPLGLEWRCRGVQTGRFSEDWHCATKLKTDFRWPGK